MCEDSVWKRGEWESRLVPQNYALAEVQLIQNPHLKQSAFWVWDLRVFGFSPPRLS